MIINKEFKLSVGKRLKELRNKNKLTIDDLLDKLLNEHYIDIDVLEFIKKEQIENNCAVLCYDEEFEYLDASLSICIGKKDDLSTQAKRLFTSLREADKLGATKIYAHLPTLDGLGLALYNRMIRAAAHTIKKI